MTPFPYTFDEFFRAVHGHDAFPWQKRLANQVVETGWSDCIALPTGTAKTTAIDIAVWAILQEAHLPGAQRRQPTRIWYVVDRRLLVDSANKHAQKITALLSDEDSQIGNEASAALRHRAGFADDHQPLYTSVFRGGTERGFRPAHPAKPAVLCATVAMYASRLLFNGYGISKLISSIDAAHAGTDCLVLLDEAHLAPALVDLVPKLELCDANRSGILRLPGRFEAHDEPLLPPSRTLPRLVSLTATSASSGGSRFELDDDDHRNEIIARRIRASKPTRFVALQRGESAKLAEKTDGKDEPKKKSKPYDKGKLFLQQCIAELNSLLDGSEFRKSAVVFVNRPSLAVSLAAELQRDDSLRVLVATGQLREPDAQRVRMDLLATVESGRSMTDGEPEDTKYIGRKTVVVATQTLEVGADIDVDVLVTQSADRRAIIQRLGRLNRRGERPWAEAVIIDDPNDPNLLYQDDLPTLVSTLTSVTQSGSRSVDLSPVNINEILGSQPDAKPDVAQLLPVHLFEWAKTSQPDHDAADPELFFAGRDDQRLTVRVAWRQGLNKLVSPPYSGPELDDADATGDTAHIDGLVAVELYPAIRDQETIDVSLLELRDLCKDKDIAMYEYNPTDKTVSPFNVERLRPNLTVLLDATGGMYSQFGWDPSHTGAVVDVSVLNRSMMPLTVEALQNLWLGAGSKLGLDQIGLVEEALETFNGSSQQREDRAVLQSAVRALDTSVETDSHHAMAGLLQRISESFVVDDPTYGLLICWPQTNSVSKPKTDRLDGLSVESKSMVKLADHLIAVSETAEQIATALGLPKHLVDALKQSGRLHDLGKADRRFQSVLSTAKREDADDHETQAAKPELYAKSTVSDRSHRRSSADRKAWPSGSRHELISIQLFDASNNKQTDEIELQKHLIASHHGYARPLHNTPTTAPSIETTFDFDDTSWSGQTNPSLQDFTQPKRFRDMNERFGYWGLALLEAIVRQADHLVSEVTEVL